MSAVEGRAGLVVLGDGVVALSGRGSLADSHRFTRAYVGDGPVAAVTYARQGRDAILVTRLGDDAFAEPLLSSWDTEGLHLDYANTVPGRNGVVLLGEEGREAISFRSASAVAGLAAADIAHFPWELAAFAYTTGSMQMLGDGVRKTLVKAFQDARDQGVRTVFNPVYSPGLWGATDARQAVVALDEILRVTDILLIKAPLGAGQLLFQATAADAARAALKKGPSIVVVRDAARGYTVAAEGQIVAVDAPTPVLHPLMETVFDGAFLAALAEGASVPEAVKQAARVASDAEGCPVGLEHIPVAPGAVAL